MAWKRQFWHSVGLSHSCSYLNSIFFSTSWNLEMLCGSLETGQHSLKIQKKHLDVRRKNCQILTVGRVRKVNHKTFSLCPKNHHPTENFWPFCTYLWNIHLTQIVVIAWHLIANKIDKLPYLFLKTKPQGIKERNYMQLLIMNYP